MFTVAVFTTAKIQGQPRVPVTDEQVKWFMLSLYKRGVSGLGVVQWQSANVANIVNSFKKMNQRAEF